MLDIKQIVHEDLEKHSNLASKFWKEKHSYFQQNTTDNLLYMFNA